MLRKSKDISISKDDVDLFIIVNPNFKTTNSNF